MRVFAKSKDDYYYTQNETYFHSIAGERYSFTPDRGFLVAVSRLLEKGIMVQIDTRTNNVSKEVAAWFDRVKPKQFL